MSLASLLENNAIASSVAFFLRGDAKDKIDDFKGRLIQLIQRKLQTGMDYFLPKFQM